MDLIIPQRKLITGTFTQTVTAVSIFVFPHGLSSMPGHISITPKNATSAVLSYTTWDATNVTVTYTTTITGTVLIGWKATSS